MRDKRIKNVQWKEPEIKQFNKVEPVKSGLNWEKGVWDNTKANL